MQRVKGIGGIFFKCSDPQKLNAWYEENLGVPMTPYGCAVFNWKEAESSKRENQTVWSSMPLDSEYFGQSKANFMINYIVDSVDEFVAQLKSRGVKMEEKIEDCEQGRFAWGYDLEGNRFELWEPLDK